MVDATDSKSVAARRAGSSPARGTTFRLLREPLDRVVGRRACRILLHVDLLENVAQMSSRPLDLEGDARDRVL